MDGGAVHAGGLEQRAEYLGGPFGAVEGIWLYQLRLSLSRMKPPASWRQMAYLCPEEQRGDDRSSPRGRLSCAIRPPLLTWGGSV
jgi:hypothetical protein